MLKNVAKLEVKIAERSYQLFVDQDSPLGEVKEALFQFQKYVGQIEDVIEANKKNVSQEQSSEEKPLDPPKE